MGEALVDLTGGCCEKISFTSGEDVAGKFGVYLQEWILIGNKGAYIGEGVNCQRPIPRRPDLFLDVSRGTALCFPERVKPMVEDGSLWETLRRFVAPNFVVACLQVSLTCGLAHRINTACSTKHSGWMDCCTQSRYFVPFYFYVDVFFSVQTSVFFTPCNYPQALNEHLI